MAQITSLYLSLLTNQTNYSPFWLWVSSAFCMAGTSNTICTSTCIHCQQALVTLFEHTHNTHTHTHIYIYMCVCVCVCVTRYGLDGPGIESWWGARFSAPVQTDPGAHPPSCTMGTGSLPGVKRPRCGPDHPPPSKRRGR